MRIYNGKNSMIDVPLAGKTRLNIPAHTVSKEFMPSDDFLTMMAGAFTADDVAIIVSGPYEINLCAKNPAINPLVTQTLDEAVIRFNGESEVKGEMPEVEVKVETKAEPVVEEEAAAPEEEPVPEAEAAPEVEATTPKKKKSKK